MHNVIQNMCAGSETTGVSIFDLASTGAKTGIRYIYIYNVYCALYVFCVIYVVETASCVQYWASLTQITRRRSHTNRYMLYYIVLYAQYAYICNMCCRLRIQRWMYWLMRWNPSPPFHTWYGIYLFVLL